MISQIGSRYTSGTELWHTSNRHSAIFLTVAVSCIAGVKNPCQISIYCLSSIKIAYDDVNQFCSHSECVPKCPVTVDLCINKNFNY